MFKIMKSIKNEYQRCQICGKNVYFNLILLDIYVYR